MKKQFGTTWESGTSPFGIAAFVLFLLAGVLLWSGRETMAAALTTASVTMVIAELTRQNVKVTQELVQETRDARTAQTRPVIGIKFERVDDPMDLSGRLELVIGHYGGGPARNVRFRFAPKLVNEDGKDIGAEPPFSTGIPMIAPGDRIHVPFGSFDGFRTHWFFGPQPDGTSSTTAKFAATITFNDPLANNREYTDTFPLGAEHLFEFNQSYWRQITPEEFAEMPDWLRRRYENFFHDDEGGSEAAD